MLLILEEYFKDHPVKKRIVEGLYNRGISVKNSGFFLDGIEISVSEIANAFNVNRRTVYDTVKVIEGIPEIRAVMEHLHPSTDLSDVAPMMGDQVITVEVCPGFFGRVMESFIQIISKYGCYVKEIHGRNIGKDGVSIRAIFYRTFPSRLFAEISSIEGVRHTIIDTAKNRDNEIICDQCEVRVCPSKISSEFVREDEVVGI